MLKRDDISDISGSIPSPHPSLVSASPWAWFCRRLLPAIREFFLPIVTKYLLIGGRLIVEVFCTLRPLLLWFGETKIRETSVQRCDEDSGTSLIAHVIIHDIICNYISVMLFHYQIQSAIEPTRANSFFFFPGGSKKWPCILRDSAYWSAPPGKLPGCSGELGVPAGPVPLSPLQHCGSALHHPAPGSNAAQE